MASSTRFSKIGNWFGAADRPPDQVLQSDDATTITSSASHLDFSPPDGVMLGLDGLGRLEGENTDNLTSAPNFAIEGNAPASVPADLTVTGPAVDQGTASVEAGSADHVLVNQGNINNQGHLNTRGKLPDPGHVNIPGGNFDPSSGIAGAGSITMPHTADGPVSSAGLGQIPSGARWRSKIWRSATGSSPRRAWRGQSSGSAGAAIPDASRWGRPTSCRSGSGQVHWPTVCRGASCGFRRITQCISKGY